MIEALWEKQETQALKPTIDCMVDEVEVYKICGDCGERVYNNYHNKQKFCSYCGAQIDWSEDNDE